MGLSLDCSGAQQSRSRKQGEQTTLYHLSISSLTWQTPEVMRVAAAA
jgi:hypothetical protein